MLDGMSFMDALVPDVVAIVKRNVALSGEGYCVQDTSFAGGHYTGQRATSGTVLRHGYGRMDFDNGDWYQGEWWMDDMQGMGCFYHKKRNFGFQGTFDDNCSVYGAYYFGSPDKCEYEVESKAVVHVLRERSWQAVHVTQDNFWESMYKS